MAIANYRKGESTWAKVKRRVGKQFALQCRADGEIAIDEDWFKVAFEEATSILLSDSGGFALLDDSATDEPADGLYILLVCSVRGDGSSLIRAAQQHAVQGRYRYVGLRTSIPRLIKLYMGKYGFARDAVDGSRYKLTSAGRKGRRKTLDKTKHGVVDKWLAWRVHTRNPAWPELRKSPRLRATSSLR